MIRSAAFSGLLMIATVAASADEVPFASPPPSSAGPAAVENLVNLGDIMQVVQLRHIKLWYAGEAKNWDLVDYELDLIDESLRRSFTLYLNIPVEFVSSAAKSTAQTRAAAKARNPGQFAAAYAQLTAACNACHAAGKVGFVRIQTPISSPFSDESFIP